MTGKPGHGGPKRGYKQTPGHILKRSLRPKRNVGKLPPVPPETVALAFERLGSIDAYVEWIQRSPYNTFLYYTQHYPQLIPMTLKTTADVTVNGKSSSAMAKLEQLIGGLMRAQAHDDNDGSFCCPDGKTIVRYEDALVIEHQPTISAPVTGDPDQELRAEHVETAPRMPTHSAVPQPAEIRRLAAPPEPAEPRPSPSYASREPPNGRTGTRPEPHTAGPKSGPKAPSIPGLCVAAAVGAVDDKLSTTERFYLWSGHRRGL